MISTGQTLTNPVTGETLVFRTTSADSSVRNVGSASGPSLTGTCSSLAVTTPSSG